MDFGKALESLKEGKRVARKGWNGKGIFIELQRPDEHSKMTHPYIYIDTLGLQTDNPDAPKDRVPWLASQTDMLAEDWEVIETPAFVSVEGKPVYTGWGPLSEDGLITYTPPLSSKG